MMPVTGRRVSPVETENTIEAYTFLARHLLTHFPRRIADWRPRQIVRHALDHITGERTSSFADNLLRSIR